MGQKTLMGAEAEQKLNKKVVAPENNRSNYSRFFAHAFEDVDVSELIDDGAGMDFENFKNLTKAKLRTDYWDKLFDQNKTFKGRDGLVRQSRFKGKLSSAIYKNYFEGEKPRSFEERTYKRNDKEYKVNVVRKGYSIDFNGKKYVGGRFLPRKYFEGS